MTRSCVTALWCAGKGAAAADAEGSLSEGGPLGGDGFTPGSLAAEVEPDLAHINTLDSMDLDINPAGALRCAALKLCWCCGVLRLGLYVLVLALCCAVLQQSEHMTTTQQCAAEHVMFLSVSV